MTGGSKLWLCARGHGSAAYKARRSSWIHPFEAELAGVLQDELAVACVVAIELKAGLVCDERLKERLALDEPKLRNIPSAKMENIESIIDDMNAALAIARRLSLGKARRSRIVDAAEFAVDIGGLHIQVRKGSNHAWIFAGPVQPGPCEQLRAAVVDARGHAIAVELDLMHPLRPRRRLLDRLGKLRGHENRKGGAPARPIGFDGL